MYLMDSVAKADAITREQGQQDNPVLRIFPDLMQRMKGAPRFLLDKTAIAAAVEVSLGRPLVMLQAMEHLRVPYPVMWIEWDESGRDRLRQLQEPAPVDEIRPLPKQLGFLVEVEEDSGGRRGCVTWLWSSREPPMALDIPNVGPISAYFDLDQHGRDEWRRVGNVYRMWEDNAIQLEALKHIWFTAEHRPSPWGAEYLANTDTVNLFGDYETRFAMSMADVYGEYIIIWAIMLMLTASRQAVEYRPVDRTKLNKARAKRREIPLLDHTEVVMHVSKQLQTTLQARSPLMYSRKSPRIHMVSRYLARRGDKHWIVEPYVRGSGETIARHVHVRG